MLRFVSVGLLSMLLGSATLSAQERGDHYQGEEAASLQEALVLFSGYNQRLAAVLAKDELDIQDLITIHELTYTLENALDVMRSELADLAETLEALHVASERADTEGARRSGDAYLDVSRVLAP